MTTKQKELIESAKPYEEGIEFSCVYIINSGKNYNGFWGKNDYRQIIVIGESSNKERYKIEGSQYDVLEIENKHDYPLKFDIPKDKDCIRVFTIPSFKIICSNHLASSLMLEVIKCQKLN